LARYYAPDTVACIRASKGCYWGRCTFCDSYYGLRNDEMSLDRLIEEIRHLTRNFGIRHFEFIDQCISPARLRKICDAMVKADLGVRWFCNARTDVGFDQSLFADMVRAGATKIMWGIESGSARLLRLMQKGVDPEVRLSLLRQAAAAGLWNFAYVFFGFPTETVAEAQQTIDFICDHTDIVHSYGRSVFTLGKHCPLVDQMDELGISRTEIDRDDLNKDFVVTLAKGLTGRELTEVGERCTRAALAAYGGDPLWMHLR
jgi:anaerobic magnesium-protoporphyrin IX monomethyl ester cyclase